MGRSVVEIRFTSVYWTNIRGYSLLICHSKPASIAPGSFDGAAGGTGWATEGVGGTGAGGRGAMGMLTNCSLMNSFNLQIKWSYQSGKLLKLKYNSRIGLWGWISYSNVSVGSPEATVIRSCVLSAGSVSILLWMSQKKYLSNSVISFH